MKRTLDEYSGTKSWLASALKHLINGISFCLKATQVANEVLLFC
jgi:hypothetical protein